MHEIQRTQASMIAHKHILVYNDIGVAATEVKKALVESFYGAAVSDTNRLLIKQDGALTEDTLALVLPGIIGNNSPYNDQLDFETHKAIRDYVENGGVYVGICAGAYYASNRITYHPPWMSQEKTRKPGLDLFNGAAKGPISFLAKQSVEEGPNDCMVTTISFNTASGARKVTGTAYGNGPMYFPDDSADLEVIARYEDVPGKPIAIAARKVGKGLALFVGVLPYMQPVKDMPLTHATKDAYKFNESLKPHAEGTKEVWDSITERIKEHNASIGRVRRLPKSDRSPS